MSDQLTAALLTLLLCTVAQAAPISLSGQQSPKPGEAVRLPDGRTAIYSDNAAERVICTDTCQPTELHRRSGQLPVWAWGVGAVVAGGILFGGLTESNPTVREVPPARPVGPVTPVPEPSPLLLLLSSGLIAAAGSLRRRT